jgi:Protein of unknown function (DUF433)
MKIHTFQKSLLSNLESKTGFGLLKGNSMVNNSVLKHTQEVVVQRTPGVCGGNARLRNTRIPVWTLVAFRQEGMTEEELLYN